MSEKVLWTHSFPEELAFPIKVTEEVGGPHATGEGGKHRILDREKGISKKKHSELPNPTKAGVSEGQR